MAILVVMLLVGRLLTAWWGFRSAAARIQRGELGPAEAWLGRLEFLRADESSVALLRAACARHRGDQGAWEQSLARAKQAGSSLGEQSLERNLGEVRWGNAGQRQIGVHDYEELLGLGASSWDAATAVVHGSLAQQQTTLAQQFVDDWPEGNEDTAAALYLRGQVHWSQDDLDAAQRSFEQVIQQVPNHEMARVSLARLQEQREQFAEALRHYQFLVAAAPQHLELHVGLARVLRKLGRISASRQALPPPANPEAASPSQILELATVAFETGNYAESARWFQRIDLDQQQVAETLRIAATAAALAGNRAQAESLFTRVHDAQHYARLAGELQRRLALDPNDAVAAAEWQQLNQLREQPRQDPAVQTDPLYVARCAACHGKEGDGQGPAARFLYPRPRNLRDDDFRLVSSANRVPTRRDLEQVIRHGIPGTSMAPFSDVTPDQMQRLVEQIETFRKEGIRQRFTSEPGAEMQTVDDPEWERLASSLTTPATTIEAPNIDVSMERGQHLFSALGCHQCHGAEGKGIGQVLWYDAAGHPTSPRDLTRDPMKGGNDPESIYLRLRLGMPGTPHPAVTGVDDEDLFSLAKYSASLAERPSRVLTNYQRSLRAASPSHRAPGPDSFGRPEGE